MLSSTHADSSLANLDQQDPTTTFVREKLKISKPPLMDQPFFRQEFSMAGDPCYYAPIFVGFRTHVSTCFFVIFQSSEQNDKRKPRIERRFNRPFLHTFTIIYKKKIHKTNSIAMRIIFYLFKKGPLRILGSPGGYRFFQHLHQHPESSRI